MWTVVIHPRKFDQKHKGNDYFSSNREKERDADLDRERAKLQKIAKLRYEDARRDQSEDISASQAFGHTNDAESNSDQDDIEFTPTHDSSPESTFDRSDSPEMNGNLDPIRSSFGNVSNV